MKIYLLLIIYHVIISHSNNNNNKNMTFWKKSLHGQHPCVQDQPNVDKEASNSRFRRGELFPETEGFVVANQDKVIGTRKYQKHIPRHDVDDKCRLFGNPMKP